MKSAARRAFFVGSNLIYFTVSLCTGNRNSHGNMQKKFYKTENKALVILNIFADIFTFQRQDKPLLKERIPRYIQGIYALRTIDSSMARSLRAKE